MMQIETSLRHNHEALMLQRLDSALALRFPVHPFETGITGVNLVAVMNEFTAMSIAFPYIQAGAVYEGYRHSIESLGYPDLNAKITAAVGAFLTWDEFGGKELFLTPNPKGDQRLLDFDTHFHSTILIRDIERLIDAKMPPAVPGKATRVYLERLRENLSHSRHNHNVAHMVGFERHAMAMIKALLAGVKGVFGAAAEGLAYFEAHIGSISEGEAVHVRLTESMISRLVPKDETDLFLDACAEAYAFNIQWCQDVVTQANAASAGSN
jgi:hypothetical protein